MIYITGASGFLGKNLINFYQKKNIKFKAFSRKNIKNIIKVSDYLQIDENKDATVLHLASNSNTDSEIFDEEIEYYKKISKKIWKHQIFFSSAQVYDERSKLVKSENSSIRPRNIYGKKKYEIEKIFSNLSNSTILRLSNVVGQHMNEENIINTIINQLYIGPNITLNNTYSVRDFISIDDVLEILSLFVYKKPNGIYNVSSGKGTQIIQLFNCISDIISKYEYKLNVLDTSNKVSDLVLDNSKLKRICKVEINLNLKKILEKIIEKKKV